MRGFGHLRGTVAGLRFGVRPTNSDLQLHKARLQTKSVEEVGRFPDDRAGPLIFEPRSPITFGGGFRSVARNVPQEIVAGQK